MGKRQKAWARTARENLLLALGSCCNYCGATKKLEFDCIIPCGSAHHKLDTSARMSFYRAQHVLGNIQILCETCNRIKGARQDIPWQDMQDEICAAIYSDWEQRQQEIDFSTQGELL